MTNLFMLRPSQSTTTRTGTYIETNGLDLGRDPQYPVKITSKAGGPTRKRFITLSYRGITHAKKQAFEQEFEAEKNFGPAYFYDKDNSVVFFSEDVRKYYIERVSYTWTDANLWDFEIYLSEEVGQ